ncbi:hypothetical protein [Luteolibacter sp. Populi]
MQATHADHEAGTVVEKDFLFDLVKRQRPVELAKLATPPLAHIDEV